ncbi:MAG: hypothetical protein B7Y90_09965 [Alphaproteobacteria bacterium 32-64-14]|nr:MAG: hypothetical protein B7Y90_09965 [Alphaproteobacteria bacterium 32-64-14]
MPWAGAALALLLWGGVAAWLIAIVGFNEIFAQPPLVLAGGFAALFAPGLALICAGIMAREGARSAQANAIVLTSAKLLLEPAETSRTEIVALGEAVAHQTQTLSRAMVDTRTRLDALKADIENSVSAALKAAEIVRADSEVLVGKMSAERQNLTQLADNLRNQSDQLAKAIPRHAQLMSEATRAAQDQVRQADSTLDQRLRDLNETAGHLAQRINQIDTMGAESRKRAQGLASVLMRLDEQLVQSTRMVEAATKAGELAAAATKSTAETLRDTMSDAIGSALKATETITSRSAQASDDARQSMTLLKEAALQAEATTRAASHAARAHADETEKRINQLSDTLFKTATRATNAAEDGLERARARIEKASLLIGKMKDDSETSSVDDLILEPIAPPPARPQPAPAAPAYVAPPVQAAPVYAAPVPHAEPDKPFPLFGAREAAPPQQKPTAYSIVRDDPALDPSRGDGAHDDELVLEHVASPAPRREADFFFADESRRNDNWRDLLGGIETPEPAPQVREQSAGAMIDRLDRAGVRLHVVKAADLRRIANASSQGERQRRRATHETAPAEIQRVTRMLETDRDMQTAAREFVSREAADALRVLSMAGRAREDAAPRLSAYLLLDTALGMQI